MKQPRGISTIETILLISVLVIGAIVAASYIKGQIQTSALDTSDAIQTVTDTGGAQADEVE